MSVLENADAAAYSAADRAAEGADDCADCAANRAASRAFGSAFSSAVGFAVGRLDLNFLPSQSASKTSATREPARPNLMAVGDVVGKGAKVIVGCADVGGGELCAVVGFALVGTAVGRGTAVGIRACFPTSTNVATPQLTQWYLKRIAFKHSQSERAIKQGDSVPLWIWTFGIKETVATHSWWSRCVARHRREVRAARVRFASAQAFRFRYTPPVRRIEHMHAAAIFPLVSQGDLRHLRRKAWDKTDEARRKR